MQHDIKHYTIHINPHQFTIPVFSHAVLVFFSHRASLSAKKSTCHLLSMLRFWCVWGAWQVGKWWISEGGGRESMEIPKKVGIDDMTTHSRRIIIRIYLSAYWNSFPISFLVDSLGIVDSNGIFRYLSSTLPTGRCLQCNLWHWWSPGTTPRVSWIRLHGQPNTLWLHGPGIRHIDSTLQETNISHQTGKGRSSPQKCQTVGDMLVP